MSRTHLYIGAAALGLVALYLWVNRTPPAPPSVPVESGLNQDAVTTTTAIGSGLTAIAAGIAGAVR